MSLPRYPEYKDSGVAWLGDVPGHWGSASLRWLSTRYSGGTPEKLNLDYWTDGTIPWLNSGEVNQSLISEPSTYITEEAFQNSSAKWIPQGALVMALAGQGKTKGMVAQLGIPTTCNQSMAAIIPTQEQDARFLFWWLTSNYQNIRNMAGGDLRDGLNLELLGNIPCPLAPITEQQTIAAFLDRETGKIDALIAEQRRLVELLAEKRQAVISHAVTKGLNPDAQMKDSGIEWLGEVPEHWEMKKMKQVSSLKGRLGWQGLKAEEYRDEGPFVVSSAHFDNFTIDWDACPHVSAERYDLDNNIQLCEGDVLLMKDGAALGKLAYLAHLPDRACLNSHLLLFRPLRTNQRATYISRFLFFLMRTDYFQEHINLHATGTTFLGISQEEIGNYRMALPPLDEQVAIVCYLDAETSKFDTLITEANRAIALLQERRSALISAAVTGKIDVRSFTEREPL